MGDLMIEAELQRKFSEDGVVYLPQALSAATLSLALTAYDWSLAHPGPGAGLLPDDGGGEFYQDLANPEALVAYAPLLACVEFKQILQNLFQHPQVWFMYEQVFTKRGGRTRRTPWHQDASYLPVAGEDLAVMWISFDPVDYDHALEFVPGSHRGVLYDGASFDPADDTAPLYGGDLMPRLPDIQAQRDQWPIVSWATVPGDVVIFHPGVLHGGAQTAPNQVRRTLSLRFFGADAIVAHRPSRRQPVARGEGTPQKAQHPLTRMRSAPEGEPFRDPEFPLL